MQHYQDHRLKLEETVQFLIRILGKSNEKIIELEKRIRKLEEQQN